MAEVLGLSFAVDQPDVLVESSPYTPETTPKALIKKSKKKKKVKDALQGEEYTSTKISECDLNNVETPVPELDIIHPPDLQEDIPAAPEDIPAAPEDIPAAPEDIPAAPEEVPGPPEEPRFGYGYDYAIRQNIVESTVTGEQETAPSPLYFSFSAQHRLMIHLQHRLEAICFSFGQKHMPEKLQAEGWDCPEAVELNVWTNEFCHAPCFRDRLPKFSKRRVLLDSVANIRNYAVSRTRINSAGLEKVLASAAEFAIVLEGEGSMFEKLGEEVTSTNNWLGEETDQLQKKFDAKLNVIAKARAKVDALEESTRAAFDKGLLRRQNAAQTKVLMAIERAEADQLPEVTDRSMAPSSLDWVNGLENSLMLGDDSQEESWA